MGRLKGSKNNIFSTIKSKKELTENKYKHKVGDKIIYIGGLYPNYKNLQADILSRSSQKAKIYYSVIFEDGKKMELREDWIKGIEIGESDVIELERYCRCSEYNNRKRGGGQRTLVFMEKKNVAL
jgi:hypothetical protein